MGNPAHFVYLFSSFYLSSLYLKEVNEPHEGLRKNESQWYEFFIIEVFCLYFL